MYCTSASISALLLLTGIWLYFYVMCGFENLSQKALENIEICLEILTGDPVLIMEMWKWKFVYNLIFLLLR